MQALHCRRPSPSGRCDAQSRLRRLYCCLWKTIADAPLLPAWKRWQELEYRRAKIFAHRDSHLYDAPTADAHSTGQFWRAYGQRAGCEVAFYPSRPYFFFVSFRITFSLAERTPSPLYRPGGRERRTFAATCPTCCLSMPLTTISVWAGVSTLIPSGIRCNTVLEYPTNKLNWLSCTCARKPTPESVNLRSNPCFTPCTMFATSARVVPNIAFACRPSRAISNFSAPSSS